MPRQILVLDSSQITANDECQMYWNLKYKENLTLSNEIRDDMAQGTYGHKLLELYYMNRGLGMKVADAWHDANMFHANEDFPLPRAKREFVHKRCWEYVGVYAQNDFTPILGQRIRETKFGPHQETLLGDGTCKHCGKLFNPAPAPDAHCPNNPYTVEVQRPLVEQGFSYPLLDTPEYLFVLEGKIDVMAVLNNGSNGVVDHKFQGRERSLYQKSIQFRNYAMVSDFNYVVVNYIRLHQAISEKTFVRDVIYFSSLEKQMWKRRLIEKFKRIARERELGIFEKNEAMCPGKFGYPCEFTKICNDNFDLVSIQATKYQFYKKREEWKPW
jgi:hypothetical protein